MRESKAIPSGDLRHRWIGAQFRKQDGAHWRRPYLRAASNSGTVGPVATMFAPEDHGPSMAETTWASPAGREPEHDGVLQRSVVVALAPGRIRAEFRRAAEPVGEAFVDTGPSGPDPPSSRDAALATAGRHSRR